MAIYTVEAIDGHTYTLEAPDGISTDALSNAFYAQNPEAAKPFVKESGVVAGVKKGIEQLVSQGQTAAGVATGDTNEAAKAALARNQAMDKKYADQVSFQKVLDAYKNNGLLSGAGEAISQVPLAIAEQAPNLAATFAGAKLGAKTGSTLGAVGGARGRVLGGIAGGLAGTFAPSYVQSLAGNVERQAQEQETAGQPIDINTGKAAATAVPQAALDVVGDRILLGGKLFGKMIGIPEKVLFKDGLETAEKLAKERFLTTIAKGTATGAAGEIPTEVAQQALERYQAGLSLTSPDALREYGDTAYQVGLLGPLGAAGRFAEKSGAKAEVQQNERDQQAAAEPAQPVTPAQTQDITTRYQEAEKRKADLKSQIRKVEEGSVTETADRLHNKDVEEQIKAMTPELESLATEYNQFQKTAPAPEVAAAPEVTEAAPEEVKPTRALTVGDSLDNPLGRFTKEELTSRSPKIAAYVDAQRKKMGKPSLNDYSIEDIRDAMPGQLPEAEKADLNSLIAAKTGHTGEVIYKPEDVVNIAKQKNINTDTIGFKYFLQRATGDNDLSNMSQPQLHSAFKSLSELPKYEETQNLPEKSNATHYSPEQYQKAVDRIKTLTTDGIVPSDKAQTAAKQASGLKRDSDVQYMLQSAYRNGDLDLDSNGNFIRVNPAPQSEFKVEEGFEPAEPTGFNVMRGDKVLFSTQNEAEANAKAKTLGESAAPIIKQVDKSIANEQKALDASQRSLDVMEANGLFGTPEYNKASAKHTAMVEESAKKVGELNKTKEYLQQEVTVKTGKKAANVKAYTTKEKGVSEKSFASREEALKHAIENHTVARLNKIAAETKSPGLKARISKELERRKNPKPFLAAEKPTEKLAEKPTEKPAEEPLVTAQKESIKSQLLPMLKRFGLGDVALQIEEAMKEEGSYGASAIKVALDAKEPVRVLRHESIHGLKDLGFFTPGQWKVLENQADKVWIDKYLKQRNIDGRPLEAGQQSRYDAYDKLYKGDAQAIREEAIADAFGDFDVNGAPKGLFTTLLNNMRQFFEALRNSFNGAGYMTSDDVFGKIERGELSAGNKTGTTEKASLRSDRNSGKFGPEEETISTRKPTSVKPIENPDTDKLNVGIGVVKEDPKLLAKHAELVKNDPLMGEFKSTSDEETINHFIDSLKDNLLYLWNATPKDIRNRSKNWYKGANKIANNLADASGISERAASGVLAALSPQTPWDTNVSQAARVITIWKNHQDTVADGSMINWFDSKIDEIKKKTDPKVMIGIRDDIDGKSFKDVEGTGLQPWWLRAYDETHHSREYHLVAPEGKSAGLMTKKDGTPANMPWGNTGNIEKALSILRNDSMKNISDQMGDAHKVRSFYNNIVYPDSPDEHVTIDTHAVAAARFEPLSGNAPEVAQAWGGQGSSSLHGQNGLYGEYAEAYRRAAQELGVLPREVQSVTWEKVRGLFPDTFKTEKAVNNVKSIWKQYQSGEITIDEAREQITASSPNKDPNWSGVPTESAKDAGASLNDVEPTDSNVRGNGASKGADGVKASLRTSFATPEAAERAASKKEAPRTEAFKQFFAGSQVEKDGRPQVMYHASPNEFSTFSDRKPIFVSPDAEDAQFFSATKRLGKGAKRDYIYPLWVRAQTPFDYENPNHVQMVVDKLAANFTDPAKGNRIQLATSIDSADKITKSLEDGRWSYIEDGRVQDAIKELGFDSFYVSEGNTKNLAVFSPSQVKSVTGNEGAFDLGQKDIRYSLREFRKDDLPKDKKTYTIPANTTLFHGSHKTQAEQIETAGKVLRSRSDVKASGGYTNEGGLIFFGDSKTAEDWAKNRGDPMSVKFDQDAGVIRDTGTVFQTITDRPYQLIKRRYELSASEAAKVTEALGLPEYKSLSAGDTASLAADRGDSFSNSKAPRYEVTKSGRKQTMSAPWPIIFDALGVDGYFDDFGVAISAKNGIRLEGNDGKMERFSLRTNVTEDIKNMPNGAAIYAAINRTTQTRQEVGYVERMASVFMPESYSYFRQKAVDRYNRLSDVERLIAKQMGGVERLADSNAHSAALQSDLAAGVTASALGVGDRIGGMPVYKNGYTTVSNEGGTVKGAVAIFAPLARHGDPKIYQAYQFWAASKRGQRLLANGKEELFTPQDFAYAKQLEQQYPEFVSVQKDWIKYNDGLVKYAVDTGVISAQNAAEFVKYSDYLPFYRQIEGERTIGPNIFQSISGVKAPKKITGSEAPLADFLETIVRNTQATIQAGMKNVAAKKAADAGVMVGMVRKLDHVSSSPNTITILEKGQKVSYECADRLWVDAVSSLNLPELPFLSIFAKPADWLRNLVTKDPGFMLANLMRDSVSAYVTSGAKITPLVSTMKEFGSVLMGSSPEYQKLLSAGVLGGYEFSRDIEASTSEFAKDIRKKTGTKTAYETAISPFTFFWNGLEKGTNASDAATRIAIYKATLKETGNEAEALHRSLEVMNFNRKGSSAVVRIAAAVMPFLNARVQGLDVFFRSGIRPFFNKDATAMEKQVQKAMFIRGSTIIAMSAMYAAAISGDPDYEKQEDEVKDNNWIIPLGNGKPPLKIPTPFEVGTLFKTLPERIYRSFHGDTNKDSIAAAKRGLWSIFGTNPVPQVAAPLLEATYNYSMFTGREIVSGNMKGLAPEYQVGAGTSKVAEKLGMETGLSPIKLDYILKGYTGTMGMYALDVIDASIVALGAGGDKEKASKRFEQMPVIKRFFADPEARGQITAYYDLKNSVDTVVRTVNFLEKSNDQTIGQYVEKNAMLYASKDFMNGLNKQMQDLQDQANMIRSLPASAISANEKRDILLEITKAQNLLVNDIRAIRKVIQP